MKQLFFILFILGNIHTSKAQIADIFGMDFPSTASSEYGVIGNYDINSNALTNSFTSKFYKGGYISSELKGSVLGRVKNANRVGGNTNLGIYATYKLKSSEKNNTIFFSVRDRAHFDTRFSKDLFKIGFYGNAEYAGKTADLNDFNINFIRYQQLQVGMHSSASDSSSRWGIGISFLKGEQLQVVTAKKAELYTSVDGQFINLDTELSAVQSDTANKGIEAFNGAGASIDLFFEAPFYSGIGYSKLRIAVADIGTIRYNYKTLTVQQDSLFEYEGIQVDKILDFQNSTLGDLVNDSIINTIAPSEKQSYSVIIPTVLNLELETELNKFIHLTEGIQHVFNANYKVLFFIKGTFYLGSKFVVSTTFAYGGYGSFNYGLGLTANIGKGFIITAKTNNLEGFISPDKTTGQGAFISFAKRFK